MMHAERESKAEKITDDRHQAHITDETPCGASRLAML